MSKLTLAPELPVAQPLLTSPALSASPLPTAQWRFRATSGAPFYSYTFMGGPPSQLGLVSPLPSQLLCIGSSAPAGSSPRFTSQGCAHSALCELAVSYLRILVPFSLTPQPPDYEIPKVKGKVWLILIIFSSSWYVSLTFKYFLVCDHV